MAQGEPDGNIIFSDGRTGIITRTKIGDRTVDEAVEASAIKVEKISLKTFMVNWERGARYKRAFVPQNIEIHRFLGRKVPDYNREAPNGTFPEYIKTGFKFINYRLAKFKWYRMLGLRLFQSAPALAHFKWNRNNKARKFLKALPRMERFYEKYAPPNVSSVERSTAVNKTDTKNL